MNGFRPGRNWLRSSVNDFAFGSPKLADVYEESVGALRSKSIVDVEVGPGSLVELDPEPCAPAGLKGLEPVGVQPRQRLGVGEDDGAEEAVGGDWETIFGFEVDHFVAAEPTLDIASAGTGIGIPVGGREVEIGRFAAQDEPVVIPKGEDITR